jgi:Gas vesicle synthesis protein GvpO
MRKIIGTIGATLAIVVVASSAALADTQDMAADPCRPSGRDSSSADLRLAQRAHDGVRRLVRGDGLAAVVSDAPEGLRAKRRDAKRRDAKRRDTSVARPAGVDGGWELAVDVVELRRVPDTASVLATYRVTTDDAGEVAGYERVRRFNRGEAD